MKKILSILMIAAMAMTAGFVLSVDKAEATPAFARNMGLGCGSCHTNYPILNMMGRAFVRSGYDAGEETDLNDRASIQTQFPIGAVIYFRPVDIDFGDDKGTDSTDEQEAVMGRAGHEIQLFYAGRHSDFSYFVEIEAEDGHAKNDWGGPEFFMPMLFGGWHPMPEFNIKMGVLGPYGPDGLNTLSRVSGYAHPQAPWDDGGFTVGDAQSVILYGYVPVGAGELYYSGAWHGTDGMSDEVRWEKNDPQSFSGRLAYDQDWNGANVSIGGYFSHIEEPIFNGDGSEADMRDRKNLFGIDASLIYGGLQMSAMWGMEDLDEDDFTAGETRLDDWGITAAAEYVVQDENTLPLYGLAVYFDHHLDTAMNVNGTYIGEEWTKMGIYGTYFMRDNMKMVVGWSGTVENPDECCSEESDSRFRIQFALGI